MTQPFKLHHGDCIEVMRAMPDNSVDSVVTDPPYELGFMGKKWDATGVANDPVMWSEVLRVLKPGGHLLAFSGSRTYHRMTCAIEDAGFDIRDQIMWVFGSGFPKSLNVSKAIERVCVEDLPEHVEDYDDRDVLIAQWQGWGTALKPAHEPICVARKPLSGTVAANVLAFGTGAINIDGCRVEASEETIDRGDLAATYTSSAEGYTRPNKSMMTHKPKERSGPANDAGRWPANLIHDGSAEVVALFPDSNGSGSARTLTRSDKDAGNGWGMNSVQSDSASLRDAGTGSAARFFYCAKASRADRNEGLASVNAPAVKHQATMREKEDADWSTRNGNSHPTVKPTELMAYLCRLVTPPNGVVLDPFMGSGSTGKAAIREGFTFIGIEREQEYIDIARARIEHACRVENDSQVQQNMEFF